MANRHNKRKNKQIRIQMTPILFLIMLTLAISISFTQMDKRLSEIATEISHTDSKLTANKIIDNGVNETIKALSLESADLFISQQDAPENISANTLLINQFCAMLSTSITDGLKGLSKETISIPMGQLTGIDFLANSGPTIPFEMRPMGVVDVDYETAFTSVGINQVNFKIWINVNMDMRIIYPMHQESISLSRKIMLVDTVIKGTVPEQYLNFGR